uniref:Splicing factor Cactin n=1 Tax=Petromyzon marinus TaxID=7757 RepID=A0AAJ7T7A2_PETMA|nr:cactin isoform X2 [Petromyzon marinus]
MGGSDKRRREGRAARPAAHDRPHSGETGAEPMRQRSASPRERGQRTESPSKRRGQRSESPSKRRGQRTESPGKRRGQRSASPRERGQRSASPAKRKGQRSGSPRERGQRSGSPRERGQRSESPAKHRGQRAASRERGQRSATPVKQRRQRSGSPREKVQRPESTGKHRGQRSLSPVKHRGQRSLSPVKHRGQRSLSPGHRSLSPVKHRGQPSVSPVRRRGQRSGSPVRRRGQPSVSPVKHRGQPSVSPVRRRGQPSVSPVRRRGQPSVSPVRRRRQRSGSPSEKGQLLEFTGRHNGQRGQRLGSREKGQLSASPRGRRRSESPQHRGQWLESPRHRGQRSLSPRCRGQRSESPGARGQRSGGDHGTRVSRWGPQVREGERTWERWGTRPPGWSGPGSPLRGAAGGQRETSGDPGSRRSKGDQDGSSDSVSSNDSRNYDSGSGSGGSMRGRSGSRSRSRSSEIERTRLRGEDKKRQREERRRQRELVKALETPEEKRARRLSKKEAKERKRREKMGWGEEYMGYTNADNPFGDNNLLGTFIWHKALETKGISHLSDKDKKERNKGIQKENRIELQKVKQLRLEREREQALRDQELEMMQRDKEAEHFKQWEQQEDNFHLQQAKLRSKIRIKDGRAKPIDLLAKYVGMEEEDLAVEMHEPYTFLNGLTASDLEDLLEDIRVYIELEQGKNVDFWKDMTIITEDELGKLRKKQSEGTGPVDRREGINPSVAGDVSAVFKGKTYAQLTALNQQITGKIVAGGTTLDIGYWEGLLQQLRAYTARARLRERHQDILRLKLFRLKQEQGVQSQPLFPIMRGGGGRGEGGLQQSAGALLPGPSSAATPSSAAATNNEEEDDDNEEDEAGKSGEGAGTAGDSVLTEADLVRQSCEEYEAGRYSPTLLPPDELPVEAHVMEAEEDNQRLYLARKQLQETAEDTAEDAFERRAREGMGTDEARFSVEVPLTDKLYLWSDKYRPRKPRFFNRVHTGFEWNKYNQTHYDFDNPPPKIVQGYKFNIFYPDLIDKKSTPQYFLESSDGDREFATLRFHAGPPYEDIAFKIVSREWEYSHRHGFRCQFANSIFQLWFHFKRYRYRR